MQKALAELIGLPEAELVQIFDREPVLVTQNGEPQFVAQSLESFDAMVRRLRELEAVSKSPKNRLGKLVLFQSNRPR